MTILMVFLDDLYSSLFQSKGKVTLESIKENFCLQHLPICREAKDWSSELREKRFLQKIAKQFFLPKKLQIRRNASGSYSSIEVCVEGIWAITYEEVFSLLKLFSNSFSGFCPASFSFRVSAGKFGQKVGGINDQVRST